MTTEDTSSDDDRGRDDQNDGDGTDEQQDERRGDVRDDARRSDAQDEARRAEKPWHKNPYVLLGWRRWRIYWSN